MGRGLVASGGAGAVEWRANRKSPRAVCTNGVYAAPCPPSRLRRPRDRDDALLARFAGGDRPALDELFRRYRGAAYRVAYRLLGNEEDALDAVQDGFVKALTHLDRFRGQCSFKTWLLRMVSNAALDVGRQRRRRDGWTRPSTERVAPTGGATPDHPPRPGGWSGPTCGGGSTRPWRGCPRPSGRRSSCTWTAD